MKPSEQSLQAYYVVPGTVCDRWVEWNLTGRLVGDCPLIV